MTTVARTPAHGAFRSTLQGFADRDEKRPATIVVTTPTGDREPRPRKNGYVSRNNG